MIAVPSRKKQGVASNVYGWMHTQYRHIGGGMQTARLAELHIDTCTHTHNDDRT